MVSGPSEEALQLWHIRSQTASKGTSREYEPGEHEDRETAEMVGEFGEPDCAA